MSSLLRRPDYAPDSSDEEDNEVEVAFVRKSKPPTVTASVDEEADSRLRRLREREQEIEGDVVER